jgi:VWFA-related protein
VSVLDRERRPVRGLTAADFTVLEDGVPLVIRSFTALDMPDVIRPSATWLTDVGPDVKRNDDLADRRLVVIFLDECSAMPLEEVPTAKALARTALDSLGADDLVAVVHSFDSRLSQPFTTDRRLLLASIDKFLGTAPMSTMSAVANPSISLQQGDFRSLGGGSLTLYLRLVDTLATLSEWMSDLPQRRKAIIFVSIGIPLDICDGSPELVNTAGYDRTGAMSQLLLSTWDAIAAAQRSNVSIYALDPGGLRTMSAPANQDFIKGISEATGGFAITDTNDPRPGIEQMIRENSSYYLLGYQSTNNRAWGLFRKIEIRINRPGVTVRSRNGYREPQREQKGSEPSAAEKAEAPFREAVSRLSPRADVAMQMTAAPFAIPGRDEAAVAIATAVTEPAPIGVDRVVDHVKLRVTAFDLGGKQRASEAVNADVVLKPTRTGEATYELLSRMALKPGRYQIRTAVQSSLREKTGSVFYDIEVPDFSNGRLALSGVVVSVAPERVVAPRDKLAAVVPVIPTCRRDFRPDDQVSAYLQLYQPGNQPLSPVELAVTVTDSTGVRLTERHDTLAADRFAKDRTVGTRLDVPVANLRPGLYLLTIEAAQQKVTLRRQVRFTVRQ